MGRCPVNTRGAKNGALATTTSRVGRASLPVPNHKQGLGAFDTIRGPDRSVLEKLLSPSEQETDQMRNG